MATREMADLAKNISPHILPARTKLFTRRAPTSVEPKPPAIYVLDRKIAQTPICEFRSSEQRLINILVIGAS
jgi:hypothetical protein